MTTAPFRTQYEDLEQVLSHSTGNSFIHLSLIPWCIQYVGIVVLFELLTPYLKGKRKQYFSCACIPLTLGLLWWTWLISRYWGKGFLESYSDYWRLTLAGTGSNFDYCFFSIIGPMVHPLRAQGPIFLQGTEYLLTGISSSLFLLITLIHVNWIGPNNPKLNFKVFAKLCLFILIIYLSPTIHLALSINRLQNLFSQ